MSDSRANANLAKPQAFETKNMPGTYAPAPTPEFHQQNIDPGYSNSAGPEGDDGGQEWATSDAADGKFSSDQAGSTTETSASTSTEDDKKAGAASRKASTAK